MAILGSVLVAGFALRQSGGSLHAADLAIFLAVLLAAMGYAAGGRLSQTLGGQQTICWALVLAAPPLLPVVGWLAWQERADRHAGAAAGPVSPTFRCSRCSSDSSSGIAAWRWAGWRGSDKYSWCSPSCLYWAPPWCWGNAGMANPHLRNRRHRGGGRGPQNAGKTQLTPYSILILPLL
jgi:hypothetical protein